MDAADSWDLRCLVDNVQGMVDALTCLRWKKQQVCSYLLTFFLSFFLSCAFSGHVGNSFSFSLLFLGFRAIGSLNWIVVLSESM